ncbi:MAG: hypothetical protein CMA64_10950 [Euryarchaeota archaeon]|nr:hypothetical protein [Euryarchaeota archaeon]
MKLKQLQTTNLFYNRYIYKLRVRNEIGSIFRGMNLGYAKSKIDVMQQYAESEQNIRSPFDGWRKKEKYITLETFMDTLATYNALESNKDECMVRCENHNLDIYSNESKWLKDLSNTVESVEFWEPKDDVTLEFLLDNKNTIIVNRAVSWPFKAILGKRVDPKFAQYCLNNVDKVKIGKRTLKSIQNGHNTEGYYFMSKDEKCLMLAKIALGGAIRKIVKYVSDAELHK